MSRTGLGRLITRTVYESISTVARRVRSTVGTEGKTRRPDDGPGQEADDRTTTVTRESLYLLSKNGDVEIVGGAEQSRTTPDEMFASARPLRMYIDTFPIARLTWSRYYAGLASTGLVVVLSKYVSVPVVSNVNRVVSLPLLFCLLACSALYQLYTRVDVPSHA